MGREAQPPPPAGLGPSIRLGHVGPHDPPSGWGTGGQSGRLSSLSLRFPWGGPQSPSGAGLGPGVVRLTRLRSPCSALFRWSCARSGALWETPERSPRPQPPPAVAPRRERASPSWRPDGRRKVAGPAVGGQGQGRRVRRLKPRCPSLEGHRGCTRAPCSPGLRGSGEGEEARTWGGDVRAKNKEVAGVFLPFANLTATCCRATGVEGRQGLPGRWGSCWASHRDILIMR
jgi:hypothetical protein